MNIKWTRHLALLLMLFLTTGGQVYADDIKKGDANTDGTVTVADMVAVTNNIHDNTPLAYDTNAADVNGDAQITVADVVGITNVIHYGSVDGGGSIVGWTEGNGDDELSTQDLTEEEGD